jgi:hypothetical protein
MIPISSWYPRLGVYTFPTVFIELPDDEVRALVEGGDETSAGVRRTVGRLRQGMKSLPGASFVGTDLCAPTDSELFGGGSRAVDGIRAWRLLQTSEKVRAVLESGATKTVIVRPYRRMTTVREFRLFFKDRELKAMSQMNLERHFVRLALRESELWSMACEFAEAIAALLPEADCVVDIYFTSSDRIMIVDMNSWGPPTEPLLLRTWDRDWTEIAGIKLIPPPVKMKGDVSVSF